VNWLGTEIGFTEITGLDIEREVIEYRQGASPDYSKIKMPGLKKFSNITMKRGTFRGNNEYFNWFSAVQLETVGRANITISLLDEFHQPVVVWNVQNAWPIKIQSGDLKADGNEVMIQSMEIVHEGLVILNNG
jgi:phage tail-like protein